MQIGENRKRAGKYCSVLCLLLVTINVGVNGIYRTAPDQGNYIASFSDIGTETKLLEESAEKAVIPWVGNNPQGRVDGSEFIGKLVKVWFVPTMDFMDSIANKNLIEFWNKMEIRREYAYPRYKSTTQCSIINTLLSEKYQIESEDSTMYVPYGYEYIANAEKERKIYENKYALPWGYTYENTISYGELENLNGLQRQQAMLQAVALEEENKDSADLTFEESTVPYDMIFDKCTYADGIFTVKKDNAFIKLVFSMPAGTEGYVRLSGLDITGSGVNKFLVSVSCGDIIRKSMVKSEINQYYDGTTDYLFNLGYSDEERHELTILFPTRGTYRLGDIELYCLPMDNYPQRVEALRAEPLKNVQWDNNRLTGMVDLSKDKILCVSLPYLKGWTATVDGKKTEILRGNYMFMCIPLTAGHHDIRFTYCSPGLKLGIIITLVCIAIVGGFMIKDKSRKES